MTTMPTMPSAADRLEALIQAIRDAFGGVPILPLNLEGDGELDLAAGSDLPRGLSALANTGGGVLALGVGVGPDGVAEVVGVDDPGAAAEAVRALLPEMANLPAADLRVWDEDGVQVVCICVGAVAEGRTCRDRREGPEAGAYSLDEELRVVPLPPIVAVDWTAADARPVPGTSLNDLDVDLVLDLLGRDVEAGSRRIVLTPQEIDRLHRVGVLVDPPRLAPVTLAAVVAMGVDPSEAVPGARIVVLADGVELASLEGPAAQVADRAARMVAGPGRVRRWALRELVLNALLHRDWATRLAEPVEVQVDRDGVTVWNPVASGQASSPPNRLLLRLVAAVGGCEGEGTGIARLMRRLPPGERLESGVDRGWRWTRLPRRAGKRRGREGEAVRERVSLPVPVIAHPTTTPARESRVRAIPAPASPDPREAALLSLLEGESEGLGGAEIATALGWSRSKVKQVVRALVERGAVAPTETSARSPSQRYRVVHRPTSPVVAAGAR